MARFDVKVELNNAGVLSSGIKIKQYSRGVDSIRFLIYRGGKSFDPSEDFEKIYLRILRADGQTDDVDVSFDVDSSGNYYFVHQFDYFDSFVAGVLSFEIFFFSTTDSGVDGLMVSPRINLEVYKSISSFNIVDKKSIDFFAHLLDEIKALQATVTYDEYIEKLNGALEFLKTVQEGAEVNVQPSWSETDESSDAYIIDKPDIDGEVRKTENLVTNFAVATKFEEVAEATTNEIHTATQEAKDYTSQVQEELHGHINETDGIDKKHLTSAELADVRDIPRIIAGEKVVGLASVAWNADKAYADENDNVIHDTYLPRLELEERISDTVFNDSWTEDERKKYLCTMYTIGEIIDGGLQVGHARIANEADISYADYFNNPIHETYATKEELYPTPVNNVPPATLSANTPYEFGTISELVLSFPTNANNGDVIYISFLSRDTATNLTIDTTNTTDIDLVPETNTGYEIYAKYNISIAGWIVKYSEYDI